LLSFDPEIIERLSSVTATVDIDSNEKKILFKSEIGFYLDVHSQMHRAFFFFQNQIYG